MGTYYIQYDFTITIKEAAKQLKLSEQMVRTLCRTQALEAKKIGNSWCINKKSLNQYALNTGNKINEDRAFYETNNKPHFFLSFFSGAMGFDLGVEQAGFDLRLVCENDTFCRKTILLNRPNAAFLNDINNYSVKDIRKAAKLTENNEIDLIVGGPPNLNFNPNIKHINLLLKYLELCIKLKPKYFVVENARGMLYAKKNSLKGSLLDHVTTRIKKAGYSYSFNLYNSANFGSPQTKERFILICSRDRNKPPYLTPTHSEIGMHGLQKWKSIRSCISNIKTHEYLNFPESRLKYFRLLKPGENWKNLSIDLQEKALGKSFYNHGGKTGFLRRLSWNKPSPSLAIHPVMPATALAHPTKDRPISVQEYQRIQEFPDHWKLAGSTLQKYKQIGNATPVSLGYAVGKLIMQLLQKEEIINYKNFKYSKYKNSNDVDWQMNFENQQA